jgi:hypothetical protein
MRLAIQFLVVALLVLTVRACGVNETYDRLRHGTRVVMEKVGL